ncbi:unnamed protein product [Linum trigynum]|uniref:Uncharacterized protein n=1 Tax=Linum trigynum TaxID=586398 RepID=A0AAV2CIH4_9ROSI
MEHWAVRSCEREYERRDCDCKCWRPTGESVGLGGRRGGSDCGGRVMDGGGGGLTADATLKSGCPRRPWRNDDRDCGRDADRELGYKRQAGSGAEDSRMAWMD